ncbi:MAG TPA: hypothetical protein VKA47_07705 [Solirubrobacterales bacterium]|nr:hypothetical protein [Solirubrobacterales bacterium]
MATLPDEDGDPVCLVCGTLVGTPSPPNGHEAYFAHMITDGDGQRRRIQRPRRLGPGRWGGLRTRLPSDPAERARAHTTYFLSTTAETPSPTNDATPAVTRAARKEIQ